MNADGVYLPDGQSAQDGSGDGPHDVEDSMDLSALLGVLRAPGTPDELARAGSTVADMVAAHADATVVVVPLRGINRRPAFVAVGASLGILGAVLVTGTAAAAFSGALPERLQRVAHDVLGAPAPTTSAPSSSQDDNGSGAPSRGASEFTETPSRTGSGPAATPDSKALLGLCTAYADNGPDDQSGQSVAFRVLSEAASAKDQTIEEYCAPILATAPGARPTANPGQSGKATAVPSGKPTAAPGQTRTATSRPTSQASGPSAPPSPTRKPLIATR